MHVYSILFRGGGRFFGHGVDLTVFLRNSTIRASLCDSSEYVQSVTRQRRSNVGFDPLDYGRAEETLEILHQAKRFLPVIDQ